MIKPRSVYFNFVYGHRHHYLTFCMMEMAAKPINAQRSQCEVADISLHYL